MSVPSPGVRCYVGGGGGRGDRTSAGEGGRGGGGSGHQVLVTLTTIQTQALACYTPCSFEAVSFGARYTTAGLAYFGVSLSFSCFNKEYFLHIT